MTDQERIENARRLGWTDIFIAKGPDIRNLELPLEDGEQLVGTPPGEQYIAVELPRSQ